MDRKNFIQNYMINNVDGTTEEEIDSQINLASKIYGRIENRFKTQKRKLSSGYESKSGKSIEGKELEWFEAIWQAWNEGIEACSKGGKKEAADAFCEQIKTREQAAMAYRAALDHARNERKVLEAKKMTAPYFNKWMNSGRWEKALQKNNVFQQEQNTSHESKSKLTDELNELRMEYAGTKKTYDMLPETAALKEQADKRLESLQAKIKQVEHELGQL